jgi:thiol-disulfide isomerase/thioredoxin
MIKKYSSLLCSLLMTGLPLHAEVRTWTNSSGTTLDAEFIKAEGDKVTLKLRNGNLSTFPQSKLSDADREFIKTAQAQPAPEPKPSVTADRKAKWLTKLDKAQEESKLTGLPILILFTGTSWCPYCIKLEDAVFSQKAFKTFANENLVLLLLDFGPGGTSKSKDDKKLQSEYGVSGFPTYFLVDTAGNKLAKGGYNNDINPDVFANWVKKAAPAKSP